MKVRTYLFWMYSNALQEILKGRKSLDIYIDLMSAANLFNFSNDIHQFYINESIRYIEERQRHNSLVLS